MKSKEWWNVYVPEISVFEEIDDTGIVLIYGENEKITAINGSWITMKEENIYEECLEDWKKTKLNEKINT